MVPRTSISVFLLVVFGVFWCFFGFFTVDAYIYPLKRSSNQISLRANFRGRKLTESFSLPYVFNVCLETRKIAFQVRMKFSFANPMHGFILASLRLH